MSLFSAINQLNGTRINLFQLGIINLLCMTIINTNLTHLIVVNIS